MDWDLDKAGIYRADKHRSDSKGVCTNFRSERVANNVQEAGIRPNGYRRTWIVLGDEAATAQTQPSFLFVQSAKKIDYKDGVMTLYDGLDCRRPSSA